MSFKTLYFCNVDFYRIYFDDSADTYVGHTTNINVRMNHHRENGSDPELKVSQKIKERGGEFKYEILETMWCETSLGACFREQYWINTLEPNLNTKAAFLSADARKEKIREWARKPKRLDYVKKYNSRPDVKAKKKEYASRPEVKVEQKEYYAQNKERILIGEKLYYAANRERILIRQKEYESRPEVKERKNLLRRERRKKLENDKIIITHISNNEEIRDS